MATRMSDDDTEYSATDAELKAVHLSRREAESMLPPMRQQGDDLHEGISLVEMVNSQLRSEEDMPPKMPVPGHEQDQDSDNDSTSDSNGPDGAEGQSVRSVSEYDQSSPQQGFDWQPVATALEAPSVSAGDTSPALSRSRITERTWSTYFDKVAASVLESAPEASATGAAASEGHQAQAENSDSSSERAVLDRIAGTPYEHLSASNSAARSLGSQMVPMTPAGSQISGDSQGISEKANKAHNRTARFLKKLHLKDSEA